MSVVSKKQQLRSCQRVRARRIRTVRSNLGKWFEISGRALPWRRGNEPVFRMVVTEILLQQTRAEVVASFYDSFFGDYSTWNSIATASLKQLEKDLQPLGLWRRRADVLRRLAIRLVELKGDFPTARSEIEKLPGVGQYVANAVELIQYGRSRPLLDSGMSRVLERYFGPRALADIRYDPYLQQLAQQVVDCSESLKLNWAILDLAAIHCKKRHPKCRSCPLRRGCNFATGRSKGRDDERSMRKEVV